MLTVLSKGSTSYCTPYHELDYIAVCKEVKADIFVIGEDWGKKPHNEGVENYLKDQGKKVVQVQYNPQNSSTKIKATIVAQYQLDQNIP